MPGRDWQALARLSAHPEDLACRAIVQDSAQHTVDIVVGLTNVPRQIEAGAHVDGDIGRHRESILAQLTAMVVVWIVLVCASSGASFGWRASSAKPLMRATPRLVAATKVASGWAVSRRARSAADGSAPSQALRPRHMALSCTFVGMPSGAAQVSQESAGPGFENSS